VELAEALSKMGFSNCKQITNTNVMSTGAEHECCVFLIKQNFFVINHPRWILDILETERK
jgi:hypothetical protein